VGIKMIVGLGNVGREFDGTRHNAGFMVVDALVSRFRGKFIPGKGEYYFADVSFKGEEMLFLKPTTYMNNSGLAVTDALDRYSIILDDMLVICDDFNIPLGTLRLRKGGSDGGHNGLGSIIYSLNDDSFPRLRCGIGNSSVTAGKDMAEFVLSKFESDEIPEVERMIGSASDAVFTFLNEGIDIAMNRYN